MATPIGSVPGRKILHPDGLLSTPKRLQPIRQMETGVNTVKYPTPGAGFISRVTACCISMTLMRSCSAQRATSRSAGISRTKTIRGYRLPIKTSTRLDVKPGFHLVLPQTTPTDQFSPVITAEQSGRQGSSWAHPAMRLSTRAHAVFCRC